MENETFKKISLEVYKSNINKDDTLLSQSFLSKTILKDEEKNILPNEIICKLSSFLYIYSQKDEQSEISHNQNPNPIEKIGEIPEKDIVKEENEKILSKSMEESRISTPNQRGRSEESQDRLKTPKEKEKSKEPERKEESYF